MAYNRIRLLRMRQVHGNGGRSRGRGEIVSCRQDRVSPGNPAREAADEWDRPERPGITFGFGTSTRPRGVQSLRGGLARGVSRTHRRLSDDGRVVGPANGPAHAPLARGGAPPR